VEKLRAIPLKLPRLLGGIIGVHRLAGVVSLL
jgi:hypothetical protein